MSQETETAHLKDNVRKIDEKWLHLCGLLVKNVTDEFMN